MTKRKLFGSVWIFSRKNFDYMKLLHVWMSRLHLNCNKWWDKTRFDHNLCSNLKLVSAIFYQIFIYLQIIALKKNEKCFLFHLKSSFRSRDIQIFVFPSSPLFPPVSHCFRGWSKINLKVYNVINCPNKNLIIHFFWYLEKGKRYALKLCPLIEY